MKTRLFTLTILFAVIILLAPLSQIQTVSAANGDLVGTVTFGQNCASGIGVGIAFDGTNLWFSCYASTTDLYEANPTTGAIIASYQVKGGLGALAWDSKRGKLWAGSGCGPGQTGAEIYLFDPTTSTASLQFSIPNFNGNCLDDGLAYDATNDTIYHSWDGATSIRHLLTNGTPQADDNFAWGGSGCYNSGLAIGGDLLYEGSNGCNHVWVVNKVTKAPAFDFSTATPGDPNFRDENLACDTNTFAAQGKHVMWSKEAYSPNRAHAFEIPFNSCGVGGQPAALNDYKQNRKVGGAFEDWYNTHLYEDSSCGNMGGYGCAITSLTDVLVSFGLKTLPGSSTPIDPGSFNSFLAVYPVTHSGCGIVWSTMQKVIGFTIEDHRGLSSPDDYTPIIDKALADNNLVIARIISEPFQVKNPDGTLSWKTTTHYVVFYKRALQNAPDGSPDYYILDPLRYSPYTPGDDSGKTLWDAHKETIKQIDAFYKKQGASFQVDVVKNNAPQPGRAWAIVLHSPATMFITDPNGAQTGFDPSTGLTLQNISGSSYAVEPGIADEDPQVNPPQPDVLYFGQNVLQNGVYKVQVTGTGSGPYTLDFDVAGGPSDTSQRSIAGTAVQGQTDKYVVSVVEGQPLDIQLQVTIDIKPGEPPNPINMKSQGLTPVAILSGPTFNAVSVDPSSVQFGPNGARALKSSIQDVNADGLPDLVMQFETQETGIKVDDTQACLQGKTKGGLDIQGCDQIKTVP